MLTPAGLYTSCQDFPSARLWDGKEAEPSERRPVETRSAASPPAGGFGLRERWGILARKDGLWP